MIEVKFSEWHKGYLAYKNGRRVQDRQGRYVYRTQESATKAAKKSKCGETMVRGGHKIM